LALAEPLHDALARLEQTLTSAAGFDPRAAVRDFRLLGADFFAMLLMPKLSQQIAAAAPAISLRLIDTARGGADRLLMADEIDMALDRPLEVAEWISRQVLFRSPFVIIAARRHARLKAARIKEGDAIPLDLFCELLHAMQSVDGSTTGWVADALAERGRKRRVALTLPQFYGVSLAVAAGELVAAIPLQFARAYASPLGLAIYEPPFAMPVPEISLYWHKRHDEDAAHKWLREQIVAAVEPFVV
jgi:DNA-binding transcriptional LysR family regulator